MDDSTAVLERPKVGRPKKDLDTESVRLWTDVVRKARKVVAHRKDDDPRLTIIDYLSKILTPHVDRDYKAVKKRLSEED